MAPKRPQRLEKGSVGPTWGQEHPKMAPWAQIGSHWAQNVPEKAQIGFKLGPKCSEGIPLPKLVEAEVVRPRALGLFGHLNSLLLFEM